MSRTNPPAAPSFETLSPQVESDFPADWYGTLAGPEHFWMKARMSACLRQLDDLDVPTKEQLTGLEIGCAHGVVQHQLSEVTSWRVDGCDLNRVALEANQSSSGRRMLYDIHDRKPELEERYDFIVLFDVIEHVEDPLGFLASALFHLREGGLVLINVPALRVLYSNYDRAQGHYRRYTRSSLRKELEAAGLRVLDVRYWGLSMVPLLLVRRILTSFLSRPEEALRVGFAPPTRWLGRILGLLMRAESALLKRPLVGTSALAASQKPIQAR